mgnify:CR=1 FL=1
MDINFSELENIIGYSFKDKDNLVHAMTHSSYANENKDKNLNSNERLEFLGDSILNMIISERIYNDHHTLNEGELTKKRASIVCEQSLYNCAVLISIDRFLLLGKGEEISGGRKRQSILSDAYEALVGAIFIDGGLNKARKFIFSSMGNLINRLNDKNIFNDYKTSLQEKVQSNNTFVEYRIVKEEGPDHNKIFVSEVILAGEILGVGRGRNKKESEQMAAKNALEKL